MEILIVDDESVIREGVKRTIQKNFPDYRMHMAGSSEEAVKVLSNSRVDLVLTDILMPGMIGLELMRAFKRKYPHVKWVVISAHSEFTYAQEAVRLGARDYLLKPIGKERLIELIQSLAEEFQRETEFDKAEELLKLNLKYLREAVFQRFACGLDIGKFDMQPIIHNHPHFYLVMVKMDADNKNVPLEHFIIENVLSELIEMHGLGFVVSYDTQSLLGLVTLHDGMRINSLLDQLKMHLKNYLKVPFQIMNSGLNGDFQTVPEEVARLRQASATQVYEYIDRGNDKAIEVSMQYIKAHYNEDLSLERVASIVYLNPVYFSQLFKQKTGHGYKEYVIFLRMEQAKQLLRNPQMKLAEIADRIGYQDMRHFTQIFRKKFMMTPTEYRQREI